MNTRDRILGIDPGTKRYGLAVSDELGVTAQGLETFVVAEGADFVDHVRKLMAEYAVGRIIVGMPLSMSGNAIEGTERSRELAGRIERECGVVVELRDERMTSREAERVLGIGGRGRREARHGAREAERKHDVGDIDRLAAVLLLQGYLDERNG
ncbi:MAG TPA: Holliday junction resolvase RuvX [Patescibacteria group bacterium]|nr:Holliday junction resolvase RuvX [Patescibacteria group bacterium]